MYRLFFFISVFGVLCTSTVIGPPGESRCTCLEEKVDCSNRTKSHLLAEELCVNVSKIDLSKNVFTSYPNGLQSFQSVYMRENQLTRLPNPSELHPELQILNLGSNQISNTSIELQTLSHLISISVNKNKITSLDFLPDSCNIRYFNGLDNSITSIEPLRRCNLLITLNMGSNKIKEIPSGVFEGMRELTSLELDHNPLEVITPGALRGLTSLKLLFLSYGHLTQLSDGIFLDVPKVINLYLSNNKISTMSGNVFAGLNHIKEISLRENKLTELPILNYSNCCSSLKLTHFGWNEIPNPSEAAVRSYLRTDSSTLDIRGNPVQPAALRWALNAPDLTPFAVEDNPKCGELRRGEETRVKLCAAVEDPDANWIETVRQSAPA